VLIDDTLRDLETEFGEKLVRIHRNALVMTDHLEGIERDTSGHYRVRMRGVLTKNLMLAVVTCLACDVWYKLCKKVSRRRNELC
jgi:hypothetical protein